MPISAFVTSVGLVAAVIVLRANHWRDYTRVSGCATSMALGQIWSYFAVVLGIVAILIVNFTHSAEVSGIPIALFAIMAVMALLDIIASPILSLVVKVLFDRIEGSFAVAIINKAEPDTLILIMKDNPIDMYYNTEDDIFYFCSEREIQQES